MTIIEQKRGKMLSMFEHSCSPWSWLGDDAGNLGSKATRTAWITCDVLSQKRKEAIHIFFLTVL